jgi:hypothetical protein
MPLPAATSCCVPVVSLDVDLPCVVGKHIGDTEKQLSGPTADATAAQAAPVRASALMARRSSIAA